MKNNGFSRKALVVLLMSVIFLVSAGCTTTYHYEKDAPVETQAVLRWMGKEIKTVALDEIGINWKVKSFFFGSFAQCVVYLPPGPHTLTVNYKSSLGRADALHVGENFKAGRTYQLNAMPQGRNISLSITEAPAGMGK
jgi:hypothetical protein